MVRADRVRAIIIIIRVLPVEQQIIKLENASNNNYINEEESNYIKDCLQIDIKEEQVNRNQPKNEKLKNAKTFEELYEYVTGEVNRRKTQEEKNAQINKPEIQEKSYDIELDKLRDEIMGIKIPPEVEYTLEQAKEVKMKLMRLSAKVTDLNKKVYLLHDDSNTTVTSKLARSTDTLNTINSKLLDINLYIDEKNSKVEENSKEEEQITIFKRVKNFFGKVKRFFTNNDALAMSTKESKVKKRRIKKIQNSVNKIMEIEQRRVERWARDTFLWKNGFSQEEKINKIYRELRGIGYSNDFFSENEEENYEIAKILFSQIERKHQEWLEDVRNPVNMGQTVECLENEKSKSER